MSFACAAIWWLRGTWASFVLLASVLAAIIFIKRNKSTSPEEADEQFALSMYSLIFFASLPIVALLS